MVPRWFAEAQDRLARISGEAECWRREGDAIVAPGGAAVARLVGQGRQLREVGDFVANAPRDMAYAITCLVQLQRQAADVPYRRWLEQEVQRLRLKVAQLERR